MSERERERETQTYTERHRGTGGTRAGQRKRWRKGEQTEIWDKVKEK